MIHELYIVKLMDGVWSLSSRFSNITDFQKNKTYKYTKYTLRNVFLILLSLLYCYSQKLLVLGSPSKGRPWLQMYISQ